MTKAVILLSVMGILDAFFTDWELRLAPLFFLLGMVVAGLKKIIERRTTIE